MNLTKNSELGCVPCAVTARLDIITQINETGSLGVNSESSKGILRVIFLLQNVI